MSFSKEMVNKIWGKAPKVSGRDPDLYRKDSYGNVLFRKSHGKLTDMGWEIDHITPKARGGSDVVRNLQILQTRINRKKKDDLRKKSRHSKSNK